MAAASCDHHHNPTADMDVGYRPVATNTIISILYDDTKLTEGQVQYDHKGAGQQNYLRHFRPYYN